MKKSVCVLSRVAIAALFFLSANQIVSAQTITLKMHNPGVETRKGSQYVNEFVRRIEHKSGGTLKIKVFHAGSLGVKDADILRLLSDGILDVSVVFAGYLNRDAPELFNTYTDGAISAPEEHAKAVPATLEAYNKTLRKWDIEYTGFIQVPLYDMSLFCKKPVESLEGLKGKKVRVSNKQRAETLRKLDVAGEIIPQADMYMALQTGVVDCAVYLAEVAPLMHLQEVAPYESYLLPFAPMPVVLGFSKKAWAKLSDEQKAVVREAGEYIGKKSFEETMANAQDDNKKKAAVQARVKEGFKKLPDFPAEDRKLYVEKALEVWAELAEKAGPEAVENRKRTLEAIAK